MNKEAIKQKLAASKQFVRDNQTKIMGTALALTTATAAIMIRSKVEHDNYLKEKGLYDDYYAMTDED